MLPPGWHLLRFYAIFQGLAAFTLNPPPRLWKEQAGSFLNLVRLLNIRKGLAAPPGKPVAKPPAKEN
jgi:hypothetical protein